MNQSNEETSAIKHESDHFEPTAGQRYETSKGNEYIVNYIARESGNIEDLFVIFQEANGAEESGEQKASVKRFELIK